MITILTDDDIIRNNGLNIIDSVEKFKIPRESLLKSDIVIYINNDKAIKIFKHRHDIYTSYNLLSQLGEIISTNSVYLKNSLS